MPYVRNALMLGALVAVGIVGRLVPHPPNATPLTATASLAARYVGRRAAYFVPLTTLIVSDLVIGLYSWQIMLSVYGSFALIAFFTHLFPLTNKWASAVLLPVAASLTFFIVTNGAVWAFSPWYEKSIEGLMLAYTMGLPFLRYMLLGDLISMSIALSAVELITRGFGTSPRSIKMLRVTTHHLTKCCLLAPSGRSGSRF